MRSVLPRKCAWARQQLSLRLDSELSEFGEAQVEAHLCACGDCRAYASGLEGFTQALRAAPAATLSAPVQLPRRQRRRVSAVGSLSAAATIAAVVMSGMAGLHFLRVRTPAAEVRPTHQVTALMEQKLNRLGRGVEPVRKTPVGLQAAEQVTVKAVR